MSSAGVVSAASTWSPPPAPDSTCWGSGGGRSGKATSSSTDGGGGASSAPCCSHGGLGAGVAESASGSSNPSADDVLIKQSLQHCQNKLNSRRCVTDMEHHLQRGLFHGWHLQLQYSWFNNHGTHRRWRGHTSCPGVVPATATVTFPAGEADGSIPAVPVDGTSSPEEAASATLWCLG
jgi:hypothetical protein